MNETFGEFLLSPAGDNESPSLAERVCSTLVNVLIVLMLALLAVYMMYEPVIVDGSSMNDTLHSGDTVVIRKVGAAPSRGDIVVFDHDGRRLIKRVVAVAGDKVGFCRDPEDEERILLYLDTGVGFRPVQEDYIREPMSAESAEGIGDNRIFREMAVAGSFDEMVQSNHVTVGAGKFIALGDNRNNSLDSRHYGQFSVADVAGKLVDKLEEGTFAYGFYSFFYYRDDTAYAPS